MNAKLTPEQAIKTIKQYRHELPYANEIAALIESQTKYAELGKAFTEHQKAVPCDFGYNDEDCQCGDCCDTIRRLCELSAEVD